MTKIVLLRGVLLACCALVFLGCSGDGERDDKGPSIGGRGGNGGVGGGDGGFNPNNPVGQGGTGGSGDEDDAGAVFDPNDCGDNCTIVRVGPSSGMPFDLSGNPASGIGLDPDGALVLQRDEGDSQTLIWIANTSEGTVSKVDTASLTELGRYRVPAVDWNINPSENGPSRTSVDSEGNVYVGARMGSGISKISAAGEDCPDTNGDGMITTSSGPDDVLDLGEDDCVIWTTQIGGDARGVAVQEIPASVEVEVVPDQDPVITTIPGQRYVWVGGMDTAKLHKLDAETGDILFSLDDKPATAYGLALDGRGNLWLAGRARSSIARLDTSRCVDASCQDETVCDTVCTQVSCPDACDDAILERIDLGAEPYGITVDCNQRVWLGGAWNGNRQLGVWRYDPLAPADTRLASQTMVAGQESQGINGIAADASGFVWGAGDETGVWRLDSDTLDYRLVTGTGGADFSAKGIAVDRQGRVWGIPLRRDYAMVITPGATIDDATVEKPISGFVGPYTYSDMSGEQRRLAANEPGNYQQLFEGCSPEIATEWGELEWDVQTPMGTYVVFQARTADSVPDLESAEWFTITSVPGRDGPIEIEPYIAGAGQEPGRYLELRVQLITTETGSESKDGCSVTPAQTPRVRSFAVTHFCEPPLEVE